MKIPIVLMFKNKISWTKQCVSSVRNNTESDTYFFVFINNGSEPSESEKIKEFMNEEDILINFSCSVGVSFAYNKAIQDHCLDFKHFVILHNDVIVTKGWLSKLRLVFDKKINSGKIGFVFPRTNYAGEGTPVSFDQNVKNNFLMFKKGNKRPQTEEDIKSVISNTYSAFNSLEKYSQKIEEDSFGKFIISDELCTFCTMFDKEVFVENGMFDEDFITFGGESRLLHYISSQKLYYPIMALDVYVHHNGNTTTDAIGSEFPLNNERTDSIFEEKKKFVYEKNIQSVYFATRFAKGEIKILAIREDGIGDIVMSSFGLAALKKIDKNFHITYATNPGFMGFVSRLSCIDAVIPLRKTTNFETKDRYKEIGEMYKDKFDLILNWHKFFEESQKSKIKTHRVDIIVDSINQELKKNGLRNKILAERPEYIFQTGDKRKINSILEPFTGKDICAIAPIGTCSIRSIPLDLFYKIVSLESEKKIVLILNKDKMDISWELINNRENVIDLSGQTNLEDVPPILERSKYVYTPDSGVFHIAGLLDIPCRAFFGSIDPTLRDGYYSTGNKIYYKKELECVPCFDVGCDDCICMDYNDDEISKIINGEILNGG